MNQELTKNIKNKPFKALIILSVLLFWILAPLVAQVKSDISAIKTSFAITLAYFLIWKLYEHRNKILFYK
jgi:hypothetical protein